MDTHYDFFSLPPTLEEERKKFNIIIQANLPFFSHNHLLHKLHSNNVSFRCFYCCQCSPCKVCLDSKTFTFINDRKLTIKEYKINNQSDFTILRSPIIAPTTHFLPPFPKDRESCFLLF